MRKIPLILRSQRVIQGMLLQYLVLIPRTPGVQLRTQTQVLGHRTERHGLVLGKIKIPDNRTQLLW